VGEFEDMCDDLNEAWGELEQAMAALFKIPAEVRAAITYWDGEAAEVRLRFRRGSIVVLTEGGEQPVAAAALALRVQLTRAVPSLVAALRARDSEYLEEMAGAIDSLREAAGALRLPDG